MKRETTLTTKTRQGVLLQPSRPGVEFPARGGDSAQASSHEGLDLREFIAR